ncbi:MAG: hypothetical protein MZV70_12795 [Desulfobacterales bacterium]|nr:hypothetical protein [Desulfobacterales bacterium]
MVEAPASLKRFGVEKAGLKKNSFVMRIETSLGIRRGPTIGRRMALLRQRAGRPVLSLPRLVPVYQDQLLRAG